MQYAWTAERPVFDSLFLVVHAFFTFLLKSDRLWENHSRQRGHMWDAPSLIKAGGSMYINSRFATKLAAASMGKQTPMLLLFQGSGVWSLRSVQGKAVRVRVERLWVCVCVVPCLRCGENRL